MNKEKEKKSYKPGGLNKSRSIRKMKALAQVLFQKVAQAPPQQACHKYQRDEQGYPDANRFQLHGKSQKIGQGQRQQPIADKRNDRGIFYIFEAAQKPD